MPGYGTLSPEGVGFLRPPKSRCLAGLQCWFLLMLPQYVTCFRFMLLLWSKLSGPDISPELSEICKILLLNESSWRGLSCLWPAIARSPAACRCFQACSWACCWFVSFCRICCSIQRRQAWVWESDPGSSGHRSSLASLLKLPRGCCRCWWKLSRGCCRCWWLLECL